MVASGMQLPRSAAVVALGACLVAALLQSASAFTAPPLHPTVLRELPHWSSPRGSSRHASTVARQAFSSQDFSEVLNSDAANMLTQIADTAGLPGMALAVLICDSIPLVPTQPISIATGAIFGLKFGLPAVIFGQTFATFLAFTVGRRLSQTSMASAALSSLDSKARKTLDALTASLNSPEWSSVFGTIVLVRQSPVIPFSLGNYFIGAATKAPLLPTLGATVIGCLPLNCVWVAAGAGGRQAMETAANGGVDVSQPTEILGLVGLAATAAVGLAVARGVSSALGDDEQQQAS